MQAQFLSRQWKLTIDRSQQARVTLDDVRWSHAHHMLSWCRSWPGCGGIFMLGVTHVILCRLLEIRKLIFAHLILSRLLEIRRVVFAPWCNTSILYYSGFLIIISSVPAINFSGEWFARQGNLMIYLRS